VRLEVDAELGKHGEQVGAASAGEDASGELGVIGDFGDCGLVRAEGLGRLVGAEFGLGQDQAVQRRVEDVDTQRRQAEPPLG
jgi:hypothetical protein